MRPQVRFVLLFILLAACGETSPSNLPAEDAELRGAVDTRVVYVDAETQGEDVRTPSSDDASEGAADAQGTVTDGAAPSGDAAPTPAPDPEADARAAPPDAAVEPPVDEPLVPPAPRGDSHGECPVLVGGPTSDTSVNAQFPTGEQVRSFRVLVPQGYDGTRPYPVVFAWHWLNASSNSFIQDGELESAVEQMQFITVLPDKLRNDNGDKAFLFDWPFAEVWGVEAELIFFDDLLTCVSSQYAVDLNRVYGIGVRYPLDKPDWRTAPSRATLRAWQTRRPGSEEWLSGERAA